MLLGGRLCREGEFLFGPVPFEARRARSGWELLAWRELTERGEERPQVGLRGLANLERLGRKGPAKEADRGVGEVGGKPEPTRGEASSVAQGQ